MEGCGEGGGEGVWDGLVVMVGVGVGIVGVVVVCVWSGGEV